MTHSKYKRLPIAVLALLGTGVALACGSSADVTDHKGGGSGGANGSGANGSGANGSGANGSGGFNIGAGSGTGGQGNASNTGGGFTAEGGAAFGDGVDYPDDVTFDYDQSEDPGGSCASVTGTPQGISRPIDIIFVIDNSGSMSNEIQEVEANIYNNFASIIQSATVAGNPIDYRVIMISRYGSSSVDGISNSDTNYGVCIPSPFGVQKSTGPNFDNDCSNPRMTPLRNPNDQPADRRFFHYSADVDSLDALCVVLESYDVTDEFDDNADRPTTNDGPAGSAYRNWIAQAPGGWQHLLRPNAFKTFVAITDDRINCDRDNYDGGDPTSFTAFNDSNDANAQSVANNFDAALRALSPAQFGTAAARNYVFHSIIGLNEKANLDEPYQPGEAVVTSECGSGSDVEAVGLGYQYLSKLTGGLRFPLCRPSFNPIFDAIAQGVIDTAEVPCQYDFPTVNGIINPANIKVAFTPGAGSKQSFTRVTNAAACAGNSFYFDDNTSPTQLFLCPAACDTVQADDQGELALDFGCLGS